MIDQLDHRCRPDNGVVMVGAGGHGKSVINVVRPAGYVVTAVLDDDAEKWGQDFLGAKVVGSISMLVEFEHAIIAISNNAKRMEIASHYPKIKWITAIHPAAHVYPTSCIDAGTVILPGTVVGADTSIGAHVIVSANCTIAHDSILGDYAHIAPGVHMGGGCRIGPAAFLGLGVVVTPGVAIGANTIVGAGSVVIADLPANCTAVGSPARLIEQR